MKIPFSKYHALGNDFLVVKASDVKIPGQRFADTVRALCHRRHGVGADGVLWLKADRTVDCRVDVYNADGSWAEKSGNGLRIVASHLYFDSHSRDVEIRMGGEKAHAHIIGRRGNNVQVSTGLGRPSFEAADVPVRTRRRFMIHEPLKVAGMNFPVTCLAVGNPHTVLFVADFDFDWQALGAEIENHRAFPERTNVEFVKVVTRKRLRLADWERGAGATGSSGTGAAAAVCASVMAGLVERQCEVIFDTGSLAVDWNADSDEITLSGPVVRVCDGVYSI